MDIDTNNLQSIILFLYEQSSIGQLPYEYISNFIQYLRHFAQLGILYEPKMCSILTELHKSKDHDYISIEKFKAILEQMKTVNYIYAFKHLNLIEFNQFLDEMTSEGNLTHGQALYILDRLIDLCRRESIQSYDIKNLLINIQLENNLQQPIYIKLLDLIESLAESYSQDLCEFHNFEKLLISSTNNSKRIPDDIRKYLNEMILFCKKFHDDYRFIEDFFSEEINSKSYNKMKEILQTKHFIHKKQSLTSIVQIHKHFLQISNLHSYKYLSDQQLDLIIENKYEECFKHMAQIGYLQERNFVKYLTNDSSLLNTEKCKEIQTWPLKLDLNHSNIRYVIKHLTQLELQDNIDTGTMIEIQNNLNQLARFGKSSLPQIQLIIERIFKCHGKTYLSDRNGFQLIQSYRLMLNDITHAIELEFYIQQLASEYKISDNLNYYFRQFLYRILQNELSIDELIRYRFELHNINQVKKCIELLPKESKNVFPLTLTDKLLERLKWDGKILDKSIRDQLLKYERCGVLSQDTFEEIYHKLYRTSSDLSLEQTNINQLFLDLFHKLNDLVNDNLIDLQQSIEIKERIYFLEDIIDLLDLSKVITIQSRLLYSSNSNEFDLVSNELKKFVNQEQFRLSKAQDLISIWHLNEEKGNTNEKQILKLFNELANFSRLYNNSIIPLLNRYIGMKQVNQTVHRHLIKDLQYIKDRVLIEKQAIECIRSIEIRIYKFDYKERFHEILIKKLENHLKSIFTILSHSYEQHICKKLYELVENYVKSNPDENTFDELLNAFDLYIKQNQIRPSKTRYRSSDAVVPTMSPSLGSLQSIY